MGVIYYAVNHERKQAWGLEKQGYMFGRPDPEDHLDRTLRPGSEAWGRMMDGTYGLTAREWNELADFLEKGGFTDIIGDSSGAFDDILNYTVVGHVLNLRQDDIGKPVQVEDNDD